MKNFLKALLKTIKWIVSTLIEIPAIIIIALGLMLYGLGLAVYDFTSVKLILTNVLNNFFKK